MDKLLVSKSLASVILYTLAVWTTVYDDSRSCAALSTLTDPKSNGYARLIRDIRSHPTSLYKIPPFLFIRSAHEEVSSGSERPSFNLDHGNDSVPQMMADAADNVMTSDDVGEEHLDGAPGGTEYEDDEFAVSVMLFPVDVLSLDPTNQVLDISCAMFFHWRHYGLTWKSNEYGGVDQIYLPANQLWTPSLSVLNGVRDSVLIFDSSVLLQVSHGGLIQSLISMDLKTSCELDLYLFPFDKQSCDIIIDSTLEWYVDLEPADELTAELMRPVAAGGEWILDSVHVNTTDVGVSKRLRNVVKVTLGLQRKTTYYLVSLVVPMFLFTVMNCLVFIIPPESGEKVSFLVSIFISNAVFSSFINSSMSSGLGRKVPLIMLYLMFMWVWSIITFLATVVVIRSYHKEQNGPSCRQTADDRRPEKPSLGDTCKTALGSFHAKLVAMIKGKTGRVENCTATAASVDSQRDIHDPAKLSEDIEATTRPGPAGDSKIPEAEDARVGIKAKTLDGIFLLLSLFTVAIVDIVCAAYVMQN